MIEHIILGCLYILGVAFHVMQKVGYLRKKFPDANAGQTFTIFFKEEWDSLVVSGLGLFTVQLFWLLSHYKNMKLPEWLHDWGAYGCTLLAGYCLQRVIYKAFGTAEGVMEKRFGQ
jgi:hypothetical protein